MNEELRSLLAQMEPLLDTLKACSPETFTTRKKLPEVGIYVFYEDGNPLYVGRSGKGTIPKRIGNHSLPGSRAFEAPLAVRLVKECIGKEAKGLSTKKIGETYPCEFARQKKRVREMKVRAVKIKDCTTRAAFEIYASLALGTPHNDFCES